MRQARERSEATGHDGEEREREDIRKRKKRKERWKAKQTGSMIETRGRNNDIC